MSPSEVAIVLHDLHPGQAEVCGEASRFNVVCAGRRWGKNRLGENRVAQTLLAGQRCAWFSPTYKTLAEDWRTIKDLFRSVTKDKSEQEHRLALKTYGVFEMWSLEEPDNALGRAYHRVVVDEAASVPGLEYAWNKVIRPELTDFQGDAWFFSTPKGLNYLWQLWTRGQDRRRFPDWASWRRPSAENPFLPKEDLEASRRELPDAIYRQEFLAEFVEGASGVFRNIAQAVGANPQEMRVPGHVYVIGVDWGKREDYTVASVIDASTKEQVHLERMQQVDYTLQLGRLEALDRRFRPDVFVVEENAIGIPLIEQLRRLELSVRPFKTTQPSKKELVERLSLAFEREELKILDHPVQTNELQAFMATKTVTGLERFGAPEGMHDDTVMALALAWSAAVGYPTVDPAPKTVMDLKEFREPGQPERRPQEVYSGYLAGD